MIQLIKKHTMLLVTVILFLVAALVYIAVTPKIYLASSRVAIFRMKIENPDNGSDESRNRWIWIRDGLNINSALVSDEQIKKFIESNEGAKQYAGKFNSESAKMSFFRNMVNVQYTGADESNYIIEVKSSDPKLAQDLNTHVFNNLKFLAVQKDDADFKALSDKIEQEAASYAANSSERSFYQNKIVKMKFEHVITQSQKERVFQVISEPSVNDRPVWPKPLALVVVALLVGAVIGFVLEYLTYLVKSQK